MLTGKTWPESAEILRKRYERLLGRVGQVSADDVFESLMNAYAAVYDPHSNYFSPRSSEEYRIQMSLSYEGIGASLQLVDDYVTISSLLPGGPAAAANTLKPSDRVLAVGQGTDGELTDVVGWRLDDVVQLIRGKGDTQVQTANPAGRRRAGDRPKDCDTDAWQGDAGKPGRQEGVAHGAHRRSQSARRRHHRARFLRGQ